MSTLNDSIRQALALVEQGRVGDALAALRALLTTHGNDATLHHTIGLLQFQTGSIEQAIFHFDKARHLDEDRADFHSDYGTAINISGRPEEAIDAFHRAVEIDPRSFPAQLGLSSALIGTHDYDGAATAGKAALELSRHRPEGWVNHALALLRSGRTAEGIASLRESLEVLPDQPLLLCHLCNALNCHADTGGDELFDLHVRLGRSLAAAYGGGIRSFNNDASPDRILNVAYLSSDLKEGPIASLLEPILASHDKSKVRTFCYSGSSQQDAVTTRLRSLCFLWRDVSRMAEGFIAQQMIADRIDILVDLGGHTPGARVGVLAMRGAPIQVAYLGYPNTLGMKAVTYRIADDTVCPAGSESAFTEKLMRLPGCYVCFTPSPDAPPVESRDDQPPTFGCFAPIASISDAAIETWASIVRGCAGSRLILKNTSFSDPNTVARFRDRFNGLGVTGDRIDCQPSSPTHAQHLASYSNIDVVLDPFPCSGVASTFEALDMGVPVVTLTGHTFAGRAASSILKTLGMNELIAATTADYTRIATELARDSARRGSLRTALRAQLRNSALCDGAAFTRNLESAYRDMWRSWCSNLLYS